MVTTAAAAEQLAASAVVIDRLVHAVPVGQAHWKPDPAQWSIVEVVNHLADEEGEDFRHRLESTLFHPAEAWPPIDPPAWAIERRYNERGLGESLTRFLGERARSRNWLESLPSSVDLDAAYAHPTIGAIRAGDLLASWVAHDLIHVRQLTRLHYRWLERQADPYRTAYAGPF